MVWRSTLILYQRQRKQTAKVIDNLSLISHVANVGDTRTLIIHPATYPRTAIEGGSACI